MELSGKKLKIIMINVLRAIMEKVDNMQEQMDNVSREVEILRNHHKEVLEIKYPVEYTKNVLMGSSADWTQRRRESVRLKICQ